MLAASGKTRRLRSRGRHHSPSHVRAPSAPSASAESQSLEPIPVQSGSSRVWTAYWPFAVA